MKILFVFLLIAANNLIGSGNTFANDQAVSTAVSGVTAANSASNQNPLSPASNASKETGKWISSDATIGLFGAIIGALIGAIVSIFAVYLTSKQQQKHEAENREQRCRSARSLVQAEIDHNQAVLSAYLQEIDLDNPIRIVANQSGREWIASRPPPRWSTLAWQSALEDLLDILPIPTLQAAFAFYADLQAYTLAIELATSYYNQEFPEEMLSTAFYVQAQLSEKIQQYGNPLTLP